MSNLYKKAKDGLKEYLDNRAENDPLFAAAYNKPNKSFDECMNYILQTMRKEGNALMICKEDVYNLAIHYYDEDSIKDVKPVSGAVVMQVDDEPVLTAEEKESAKEAAKAKYEAIELSKLQKAKEMKKKSRAEKEAEFEKRQMSLFD